MWFYEMKNDGFSFGTNRTPIEGSQIPDCLARYKNLEAEAGRTRKDCSFLALVKRKWTMPCPFF